MEVAAAGMVAGGAQLSQRAAADTAAEPALQQGSVVSLHRMQVVTLSLSPSAFTWAFVRLKDGGVISCALQEPGAARILQG